MEKGKKMYTTKRYSASISVDEYIRQYVDVETFLESCKQCPNYNRIWSCPPYDFDVMEIWRKYRRLELTAIQIIFDEAYAGKAFSPEQMQQIIKQSIGKAKQDLSEELFQKEQQIPGSVSLSAGSCSLCNGRCSREENRPCRFPDKMRYSIESLGGNVGLTISRLMGIELEWIQEGKLPHFFVLVCGLLS